MSTKPVFVGAQEGRTVAPGEWSVTDVPAANTQATATQASPGAGRRNVVTTISANIASSGTVTPAYLTANVIDGASGGADYLWQEVSSLPATSGVSARIHVNLNVVGGADTATTIEFSAAGGPNTIESVSMSGYIIEA